MSRHFILIAFFISVLTFPSLSSAQSDQGKKTKTRYLQLPNYDISTVNLGTISVEYAIGASSFGQEKLKDTKSKCVPKGGGLKDIVEVTTYYYEVPFVQPNAYMVAKDGTGKVIYAEKVMSQGEVMAKFGYDECKYWVAETMKKDWSSGQAKFKKSETSRMAGEVSGRVNDAIRMNIFPSFVPEEFKVFTAKAKTFDYADLDKAQTMALEAYAGFDKNGPNPAGIGQLNSAIEIWEKELESLDTEDKKARINKSIAKGLYENLLNAYLYTYQVDKAIKAGTDGSKLYGNMSNNRSTALDARIDVLRTRQLAVNQNAALAADPTRLNSVGATVGSGSFQATQVTGPDFERLETEASGFKFTQAKEKMEANEAMHDAAVASGEINPYERYVTQSATQGKMLMMTSSFLSEELTAFPKEVCEMTDLNQIFINANKIASIPPEISQLTSLKKLNLSKNELTTLPAEIGELASLESLNLSKNPLTEIPEAIKNCTSLKKVTLKETKLSADQLSQLQSWLPNAKIKY